jgi:hypothetical protein
LEGEDLFEPSKICSYPVLKDQGTLYAEEEEGRRRYVYSKKSWRTSFFEHMK